MTIKTALLATGIIVLGLAAPASAQIDDICAEVGINPGLDSPFAHVPYVYGKVVLKGLSAAAKFPNISIELEEAGIQRLTIGKTGNYCFRRRSSVGNLAIRLNGIEAGRRTLSS